MTAVYYDAASNNVYTLNAAYNTVKDETDPWTIPSIGEHSGRTALVPGFMAGVQALHDRFGKAPFSKVFAPAIWIAEHGVPFNRVFEDWLSRSKTVVTRLPETKQIFTKPDGQFYKTGELFRQPALAETLKKVAAQGSDYIYKGDRARHFVDVVQREGGKMTVDDLSSYRPLWLEPLRLPYRDYDVISLGPPNTAVC
jgi:gamma-glutamyltranspeptidase/glutathione hydrolase